MADVTINYKGSAIADMSASGTKTLHTEGTFCEDDIEVVYAKPSASSYVKLAEQEFTVNTENTTAVQIGTITIDPASDVFTSAYYIFVKIRDKAGKRAGYFLGSDAIYPNAIAANGSTTSTNVAGRVLYSYTANNEFACVSSAYGIYPNLITSAGYITIYSRYHSTYSLTLNGTYKVEVFALKYPDNVSPFA